MASCVKDKTSQYMVFRIHGLSGDLLCTEDGL